MTEPSRRQYAGLTFKEVNDYEKKKKKDAAHNEQVRFQTNHDLHKKTQPTIDAAKAKLEAAPKQSRSARRADTAEERKKELRHERMVTANPLPRIPAAPASRAPQQDDIEIPPTPVRSPLADVLARTRARMNGS